MKDQSSNRHVQDDELELFIIGRGEATGADAIEEHLFKCEECKARLETVTQVVSRLSIDKGPPDDEGSEKRNDQRLTLSAVAEALGALPSFAQLRSFSPLLPDRWRAQVVDISKNGIGLALPLRLSPGTLVQIQLGKTFILGEVRHSRSIDTGEFHTGIRLDDVWWWKRQL